jgi:hypothetical protein
MYAVLYDIFFSFYLLSVADFIAVLLMSIVNEKLFLVSGRNQKQILSFERNEKKDNGKRGRITNLFFQEYFEME